MENTNNHKGIQENERYWLHRISHEGDVSYKLLSKGYLSIGWSMLSNSGIETKITSLNDTEGFNRIISDNQLEMYRSRWNLWYFCNFKIGEYVVVPLINGEFSIYRIIGKPMSITKLSYIELFSEDREIIQTEDGILKRSEGGEIVDLGFVVQVELVKGPLSRSAYADGMLTSRMKMRQTTGDITDIAESVHQVLDSEGPINLYDIIVEKFANELLLTIKKQLSPQKFEQLIKWYFQRLGATRTMIPPKYSSDKFDGADADIIAEFDELKLIFHIQAKFHEGNTSKWAVEQISKYKEQHEMQEGDGDYRIIPWVISTADTFSEEAVELAKKEAVQLILGKEFAKMLIDAGFIDINKAFE